MSPRLPPNEAPNPPSSELWVHEIKRRHRVIAHKRVRLYSRWGKDLTGRFLLIVEALRRLRSRSCIIDGEAVACRENGIASSSG
jgi:ATP-dependent DNA ligase